MWNFVLTNENKYCGAKPFHEKSVTEEQNSMAWIKKFTTSSSQDITFWMLLGINRDQSRIKIEELLISSEKSKEGYIYFFKNSCFGPSNLTLFLLSFCYERCLLIIPSTLVFFSALFYRKFAYFQNKIVKKVDLGILRTTMLLPHFFLNIDFGLFQQISLWCEPVSRILYEVEGV